MYNMRGESDDGQISSSKKNAHIILFRFEVVVCFFKVIF